MSEKHKKNYYGYTEAKKRANENEDHAVFSLIQFFCFNQQFLIKFFSWS